MHLPHETVVLTLDEAHIIIKLLKLVPVGKVSPADEKVVADLGMHANMAQALTNHLYDSRVF